MPASPHTLPPASALQNYLDSHPPPANAPWAAELHRLAIQIAHNLRYQHRWSSLRIHTTSSLTGEALPRPMISGLPPQRLYVHPDEQVELLQRQNDQGTTGMPPLGREPEWVLPSHLREKWSLRRFGDTFDALALLPPSSPPAAAGEWLFDHPVAHAAEGHRPSQWRTSLPKRLLLATLDDDSTVVYYIVHDGVVKPRQN